ncbi:Rec8 like protein-domain-containing protein [Lipomyces japonicus]|uniref:Rec8 like protein-domain-containing protein n=1 Tax=Lipomyces japonicus TaxID=56871 RepID=UPI0034CDAD02
MFYSHDLLSRRRSDGLSTVWLVATLGSRSPLRRVHRKDILSVSVSNACRSVISPAQPLALRLSSCLLYGITAIHSQQFNYLYHDANSIYARLKNSAVDTPDEITFAPANRRDVRLLSDDPAFSIEFGLLPSLPSFLSNTATQTLPAMCSSDAVDSDGIKHLPSSYHASSDHDLQINLHSEASILDSLLASDADLGFDADPGYDGFELGHDGNIVLQHEINNGPDSEPIAPYGDDISETENYLQYNNDDNNNNNSPRYGHQPIQVQYDDYRYQVNQNSTGSESAFLNHRPANDSNSMDGTISHRQQSRPHKRIRLYKPDKDTIISMNVYKESRANYLNQMDHAIWINMQKQNQRYAQAHALDYFVYHGDLKGQLCNDLVSKVRSFRPQSGNNQDDVPGWQEQRDTVGHDAGDDDYINPEYFAADDGDYYDAPYFDDVEIGRRLSPELELPLAQSSSLLPWNLPSATGAGVLSLSSNPSRLASIDSGSSMLGDMSSRNYSRNRGRRSSLFTKTRQVHLEEDEEISIAKSFQSELSINELQVEESSINAIEKETRNFFEFLVMKMDMLDQDTISFNQVIEPQTCDRVVACQGFMHVLTLASLGILMVGQHVPYHAIDIEISPTMYAS